MVAGWRRAFYTSKDKDTKILAESHQQQHLDFDNINGSPQINPSKFTFSTTPPTSPNLHCRISDSSLLDGNKSNNSPKWSSHNSPSSSYYSLLKATLRLSKNLCGICTHSVKTGEGKAIFTAECSHIFHFPCIAAHVKNQQIITCPVCGTNWNDLQPEKTAENAKTTTLSKLPNYNDDEPLLSSASVSRFSTIPENEEEELEKEENEENKEPVEFQGLDVSSTKTFEAFFLPETALVASNKSFETLIAVLKVKAKPYNAVVNRPPVDLVTVVDIGCSISGEDILKLKRSMQVVISALNSSDRLSVVVFSSGSKRLFPLRRMTGRGRRSVRRSIEAIGVDEMNGDGFPARKEAVKKAAKILEDRRQKNPVAKIILLTNGNGHEDRRLSSTRLPNLEIPVHALNYSHALHDGAFSECIGNLLRVVAQDIKFEFQNGSESSFTAKLLPGFATMGDLHAAEERELLVELKVPSSHGFHTHALSVRSSYCDSFTKEVVHSKERSIIVPRPVSIKLLDPKIKQLIRLHINARASIKHSSPDAAHEWLRRLEAEETESRLRGQPKLRSHKLRRNSLEEKMEPLTPISAWKAAEKLAKVAIMRKSMNKVSDLHGFEDARF
ncbi:putative chromatin regulator PHD family [Medicago truncatula]|uniref:Putative chromatin regulator PHD family n=1 Tax=Medicago truncatula TaxID=3880 RepID=G7LHS8_MEDTR|nr:E3 ubiquitin-protein ligase WAVH1 [Medicago truncatula]AET03312.1 zinc finger (C3HC4-type RING finger) family protein, putative [Medicago truncatula]RHN41513.1 putative chromatin regulator PHD family [Medicago truncatula]